MYMYMHEVVVVGYRKETSGKYMYINIQGSVTKPNMISHSTNYMYKLSGIMYYTIMYM